MVSTLVVDNEKLEKSSLFQSFKSFPNVSLINLDSIDEAITLFSKRYIELLFLDCSNEIVDKLTQLKLVNPNVIIIALYKELSDQIKRELLKIGINDFIRHDTDSDILIQRIPYKDQSYECGKSRL